jgi:hypothetical protein
VRRGQKAAGLIEKMAELPKDKTSVCSAFLLGKKRGREIMRKVILVVILILSLLLLYTTSSAAEWEHLASTGVYVFYYDLDNIQPLSEITVQVILKQTYEDKDLIIQFYQKYAAKDEIIELEDYLISTMVINCEDNIFGVKSIISYKESGEIILNTNYNRINYLYIPSGSIYKALYNEVC